MKRFLQIINVFKAFWVTVIAFLVVYIIYTFFTMNFSIFSPVKTIMEDFSMTHFFYEIGRKEPQSNNFITIVDMTDLVKRGDIARVLRQIEEAEPAVVGVDMVFKGERTDSIGNQEISQVARDFDNIIWSLELHNNISTTDGYDYYYRSFFIEETGGREGVTNMIGSKIGRLKSKLSHGWRVGDQILPSFVTAVVNSYAGEEVVPVEEKEENINYRPTRFEVVHWSEVEKKADLLADRIVLFGAMHEDADMHSTPLGKMAGLQTLAYAVQTVLVRENSIREVGGIKLFFYSFLIVMITYILRSTRVGWINSRESSLARLLLGFPVVGSFISFLWVAILMGGAYLLFDVYDISFNLTYAFSAIAFLGTSENSYNIIRGYINEKINAKNNSKLPV